jgi:hypothetical protein
MILSAQTRLPFVPVLANSFASTGPSSRPNLVGVKFLEHREWLPARSGPHDMDSFTKSSSNTLNDPQFDLPGQRSGIQERE